MTVTMKPEDSGFVAHCPELDIASQGDSIEDARAHLVEAVKLFLELADPTEVDRRFTSQTDVTQVEIPVD